MSAKAVLSVLLLLPGVATAQDKLADQLRKAIVEEEVNQKLDKAIEAYTKIMAQYEEDRKVAATALFHYAECCRKLGQKDQAIAAYQKLLRDFADQKEMADAGRNQLSKAYGIGVGQAQSADTKRQQELLQQEIVLAQVRLQAAQKKMDAGIAGVDELIAARKELLELQMRLEALRNFSVQELLQQEVMLVQSQIQTAEKRVEIGTLSPNGPEMIALKKELLELQMRLDALRKDAVSAPAGIPKTTPVRVPEADQQKKLVKRVEPLYPEFARNVSIRGPVILEVVANENGDVVDVKIVGGGNPVVQSPVRDAVKQWRYSPTYVDGKAVSTQFTVTVPVEIKK